MDSRQQTPWGPLPSRCARDTGAPFVTSTLSASGVRRKIASTGRWSHDGGLTVGATPTNPATQRVSVAIAPAGRHPHLARVRVDGAAVGDLCFPSGAAQRRFLEILTAGGAAAIELEVELITEHDPALFAAPLHPPSTRKGPA